MRPSAQPGGLVGREPPGLGGDKGGGLLKDLYMACLYFSFGGRTDNRYEMTLELV